MKTDQFLLRPDVELIEKLKALADKYGKNSGQQVALEIIEQYADFWEEAEAAKQAVIRKQRESIQVKPKIESQASATARKKPAKKAGKTNNGD